MIKVDELLIEFDLTLNSLDRKDNQEIDLPYKLMYINNAVITWIKSKIGYNNIYKMGYESFRKRIDDLQVLKVNNLKLLPKKYDNSRYPGYYTSLEEVSDYMFYVSSYSKVNKKTCGKATINNNLIKEGELETLYYNDNYKPSYEWQETLATLGDNKVYVYTDSTFEVEEIYLTYLRYPKTVDKEGYIKLDGSDSINQDCELPEYAKQDIVNLAAKYAAQSTDNQFQTKMAIERESKNE